MGTCLSAAATDMSVAECAAAPPEPIQAFTAAAASAPFTPFAADEGAAAPTAAAPPSAPDPLDFPAHMSHADKLAYRDDCRRCKQAMIAVLHRPPLAVSFIEIGGCNVRMVIPNATHSYSHTVADFDTAHIADACGVFVSSAAGWSVLFAALLLSRATRSSTTASYVVSTVHSLLAIYGGVQTIVLDSAGVDARTNPVTAAFDGVPIRNYYLMITCGYLFYDLLLCIYYYAQHRKSVSQSKRRSFDPSNPQPAKSSAVPAAATSSSGELGTALDPLMFVHHILIIAAFSGGVLSHIGTYYMCCFLINEVSTLFLNANYFMATNPSLKDGTLYRLNGVGLVLAFFVFRVVWNAAAVYHMLFCTWSVHWPLVYIKPLNFVVLAMTLTGLAVGHMFLNLIWFTKIVGAATRKLRRSAATATGVGGAAVLSASSSTNGNNNGHSSHRDGNGTAPTTTTTTTTAFRWPAQSSIPESSAVHERVRR